MSDVIVQRSPHDAVVIQDGTPIPVKISGGSGVPGTPGAPGSTGPAGGVDNVASRAALAAVATAANRTRYLTEAKREGLFVFDTADRSAMVTIDTRQAVFVPPASDPTGASGAWVRKFHGPLELDWFGPAADDVTDDLPVFNAAFRYLEATAILSFVNPTIYRSGKRLHISGGKYYCSSAWEPLVSIHAFGDSGHGWTQASAIRFGANTSGIRLQSNWTSGVSTIDGVEHFSAANCIFEDLAFKGAYDSGTPNEGEYHGLHFKVSVVAIRCYFGNFQGDGAFSDASVGNFQNANNSRFENCVFEGNRRGNNISSSDTNVISWINCDFRFNRQWGSDDIAFLHNTYVNCHAADNGIGVGMPVPTMVSYLGNRFSPRVGRETQCQTNAPPATAVSDVNWIFAYAGGPNVAGSSIPTWANPTTVRAGGSYYGAGWLFGCYEEGGQGPCVINTPGATYEGLLTNKGDGGFIRTAMGWTTFGNPEIDRGIISEGYSTINGQLDINGSVFIDNPTGGSADINLRVAGVQKAKLFQSGNTTFLDTQFQGFEIRPQGTSATAITAAYLAPAQDNVQDLGISGSNRYKDLHVMSVRAVTDIRVGGTVVVNATRDASFNTVSITDNAYGVGWNGSLKAPTENAVYDKIEAVIASIPVVTGVNTGDQTSIVGITGTLAQFNTAITDANIVPEAGGTFTGDISVPAEAYGAGWNASNEVPTKNDVYDKIESLPGTGGIPTLLATYSPAAATSVDIEAFAGGGYALITIVAELKVSVDNASIEMLSKHNGTYQTAANYHRVAVGTNTAGTSTRADTSTGNAMLASLSTTNVGVGNDTNESFHANIRTFYPDSGANFKQIKCESSYDTSSGSTVRFESDSKWAGTDAGMALQGIRLRPSSGNFTGTIKVFGQK